MNSQNREIFYRWTEVVALGLVGCSTLAILLPVLPGCSAISLALPWALAPSLVLIGVLCLSFAKERLAGWGGLRHLFSYPPPWVAGLFGLFFFFLYAYKFPGAMEKLGCAPIELEAIGALLPQKTLQRCVVFFSPVLLALTAWKLVNRAGA
ncbi:hypothetical protein [Cystobacter ferrugineus]|uniref:hypothetical protein n=1 Tax=Cystobacter ferrugineus TaxID=83449 RepID=UPI00116144C4|nr:hypothetical protein [Cystobacter ferrugineus]